MRALVIDDNQTSLQLLSHLLMRVEGLELTAFNDPAEAIQAAYTQNFDIVLVDYQMPKINGLSVIRHLRAIEHMSDIPMVMVSGDTTLETKHAALEAGATEFLNKPYEPIEIRLRVTNLLALRRAQLQLQARLSDVEQEMLQRLALAIETRDGSTGHHISRMAKLVGKIARQLGMPPQIVAELEVAAPLHDIGKIGIPDAILNKPGVFAEDDRRVMETHVLIGERLLSGAKSSSLRYAANMAATHHERWDGKGYPRGLSGEEIPICGRIAAVADVFDALTGARPYKKSWSLDNARIFIQEQSGIAFDPACVKAFEELWPEIAAMYVEDAKAVAADPVMPDRRVAAA